MTENTQVTPEGAGFRGHLGRIGRQRARGQALIVVALSMTVLVLFVGLGVDTANLLARKAKLQSAVDAAALSSAQELLGGGNYTQKATTRANQILEANGISASTIITKSVSFPASKQVKVSVEQSIDTFFMRIIPAFNKMAINADATADINSYAEMNAKPYGIPGVVSELNLQTWGPRAWRTNGDPYTPTNIDVSTTNPWNGDQPYGYLFRIDVPANYAYDRLAVQIFDPDAYNRSGTPTPWPTAPPCLPPCVVPSPSPTPVPDNYASCTNPASSPSRCTTNDGRQAPGMKLNAFPNGRTAFWRVEEYWSPIDYVNSSTGQYWDRQFYDQSWATETGFTLWHFNPYITSAFEAPQTLSDQPGGASLASYTWTNSSDAAVLSKTDLRWYQPSGFDIQLKDNAGNDLFEREVSGGMYFYLYVKGISGSIENNYDLRVGPPNSEDSANDLCTDAAIGAAYTGDCYVNQLYYNVAFNGKADWKTGGAAIFAKKALPLNLDTGESFPLAFTQISKNAAGITLGIRHYDQDCDVLTPYRCGTTMNYQMQKCGCTDLNDPNCWMAIPSTDSPTGYAIGWHSKTNAWSDGTNPDPERVPLPADGSDAYKWFFGPTRPDGVACPAGWDSSWLRIESNPSYTQDTTVWEMPFVRPRLIK